MSEDSKDVKPNAESEHINLKVIGQDGSIIHFKIKKQTPLRKLMTTYCDRTGLNIANVRFRFDGQPINETDSPHQLEMEEGDTIEVFQQQTGGQTDGGNLLEAVVLRRFLRHSRLLEILDRREKHREFQTMLEHIYAARSENGIV